MLLILENMSNGFQACYTFLQNKHIKIQKEWLEACIEWIIEENGVCIVFYKTINKMAEG